MHTDCKSDLLSLPTDVADTIYAVGAQDDRGWHYLLEKYEVSISAAEKSKILFALTSNRDSDKLLRYFQFRSTTNGF